MKNTILYYYGLSTNHVHQIGKEYKFFVKEQEFILMPIPEDVKEPLELLQEILIYLMQENKNVPLFYPNKEGSFITPINQIPYTLLQIQSNDKNWITIQDILHFSNPKIKKEFSSTLRRDDWYKLWTTKIDYLEYQMAEFGEKYPLVKESFAYFIGMAETGISLLQEVSFENVPLTICHKRIQTPMTIFDFYNPFSFVIDVRVRDASEYFKGKEKIDPYLLEEIKLYFKMASLSNTEILLFFIRMLFPTAYFDLFEEILVSGKEEEKLTPMIQSIFSYESFLKELYQYIKELLGSNIPEIEWLSS